MVTYLRHRIGNHSIRGHTIVFKNPSNWTLLFKISLQERLISHICRASHIHIHSLEDLMISRSVQPDLYRANRSRNERENALFFAAYKHIRSGTGCRGNPSVIFEDDEETAHREDLERSLLTQVQLDQEWEQQQRPLRKKRRVEDIQNFNTLLKRKIEEDYKEAILSWKLFHPGFSKQQFRRTRKRYQEARDRHLECSIVPDWIYNNILDSAFKTVKPKHLLDDRVNIIQDKRYHH